MTEFEIYITYANKPYTLQVNIEYHSKQIMRIRVHGKKSSLLLENNYPLFRSTKSKKGIQWKIKEGSMDMANEKKSRLLLHIMEQLEKTIKKEFPVEN